MSRSFQATGEYLLLLCNLNSGSPLRALCALIISVDQISDLSLCEPTVGRVVCCGQGKLLANTERNR